MPVAMVHVHCLLHQSICGFRADRQAVPRSQLVPSQMSGPRNRAGRHNTAGRPTQDVECPGRRNSLGPLRLHEHSLHLLHASAHHRSQPPRHGAHWSACDTARKPSASDNSCRFGGRATRACAAGDSPEQLAHQHPSEAIQAQT